MVARNADVAFFVKPALSLTRIAVAHGHTLVREGLKALLHLQAGFMVAVEIADGGEVAAQLVANPCGVLLLAQGMLSQDGLDVRELSEVIHVLMLCNDANDPGEALNALRSGARGVVFKNSSVTGLLEALRTVAAGHVWMPPEIQARMAETLQGEPHRQLTPREREIVRQVAVGQRNGEIGKALFISEQTVKTHLGRIFRKLGVRDRLALTLFASRSGLVSLSTQRS